MPTTIKPEVSERSPYYINKHRSYELVHFCRQYHDWIRMYESFVDIEEHPFKLAKVSQNCGFIGDSPTERIAMMKQYYAEKIKMVQEAAKMTDKELSSYILKGVTEGLSYEVLRARENIPCCQETYYMLRRKFFWLLNKMRS